VDKYLTDFFATLESVSTFETLLEEEGKDQKKSPAIAKNQIFSYLCTPNSRKGAEIGRI
jgi:hypothetical protein